MTSNRLIKRNARHWKNTCHKRRLPHFPPYVLNPAEAKTICLNLQTQWRKCCEARKKWHELVPELTALGIVTRLDRDLLGMYCQTWSELQEIWRLRETEPLMITTAAGNEIQSPLVGMENRAVARLIRIGAELGLSPSSRTGLKISRPMQHDESGLAKFQKQTQSTPTDD